MPKNILKLSFFLFTVLTLNSCGNTDSFLYADNHQSAVSANDIRIWEGNPITVWNKLQHIPLKKLETTDTTNPTIAGWSKLAIMSKRNNGNTASLIEALLSWRAEYPNHPANTLFPNNTILTQINNSATPQHLAILLPLSGPLAQQGKVIRDGFLNTYYTNQSKIHTKQTIAFYDTNLATNTILTLYQKAQTEGADFIVGPLTKEHVQTLINQATFSIPTLALNYTDVGFGSLPTNLYEYGLSPIDEAQQLADKARETGHTHALIITTDNAWGKRVVKELSSRWQADGGSVEDVLYINSKTNLSQAIAKLLHINIKLDNDKKPLDNDKTVLEHERRHDFDIIFLLTPPQAARQVVPLLRYYYINNIPIYATSVVYSGIPAPQTDLDINGVTFADIPWIFHNNGKNSNRLYAVGADAYTVSNSIPRLTLLPHFPIYGATGAMTLNNKHQIFRRLPWTTIRDGQPEH